MKKAFVALLSFLLLVASVNADGEMIDLNDYKTLGFKEILKEEGIKEDFKKYSETDDQAIIYLFRGQGCGYCRNFLSFLNSITDEYGKYFKVVGFETWGDKNNYDLLDTISKFIGSEAGGVPYIIIGDKVFPGYTETYNDDIKTAIKELYESDTKYDAFVEYNKSVKKSSSGSSNTGTIVFWNIIFIGIATGIVLYDNRKKYNKIIDRLDNKSVKTVEVKEEKKKEVKKVSNAKKKK